MDKIEISLIGLSVIAATQLLGNFKCDQEEYQEITRKDMEDQQQQEFIVPGIPLNEFVSIRYKVSFKYPRGWQKNPRYEDKYEGPTGFFEVGDFAGIGEDIDAAVNDQINEYYKPYGSNPMIRSFVVDGQPARVIYPSEDQSDFYKDREVAIVIEYPEPIMIQGREYAYVVIWVTKEYAPLILSTFKFTE